MSGRRLLWVAAAALLVRVLYNVVFLSDYVPAADALHYHGIATAIGDGDGFTHAFPFNEVHATAFRPPLFPLLLGGGYAVFGPNLVVGQVLNILLGTGVVVLIALTAARLAGPRAGLAAGIVAALYPPLIANDGPPLADSLGLLLMMGLVLLLMDGRVVFAGVALGLLVLTKPSAQWLVFALAAWVVWRFGWRRAAVFVGAGVLVVSPWVLRNWQAVDSPVLVTSNSFNLAARYAEPARQANVWVDPIGNPGFDEIVEGVDDEVELENVLRDAAVRSLRDHPLEVLDVAGQNLRDIVLIRPGYAEVAERFDGRNISVTYASVPLLWFVLPVGIGGLWAARRRPGAGPLLIVAGYFFLTLLLFTTPPRLRSTLDACAVVGVGVVVAAAADLMAASRREPEGARPPTNTQPAPASL